MLSTILSAYEQSLEDCVLLLNHYHHHPFRVLLTSFSSCNRFPRFKSSLLCCRFLPSLLNSFAASRMCMDGHLSCGSERITLGILFIDGDSSSSLTKETFLSVAKAFSSLSLSFSISYLLSRGRADAPPISIGSTISPYNLGSAMWQLQARKPLAEA